MSRSAQLNSEKKDNRLPIDTEARKKNRTLPTAKVLELLKTSSPGLFKLSEVVGKWVWVSFRETPAPELRQILAQLGFHWNRERQAWHRNKVLPALIIYITTMCFVKIRQRFEIIKLVIVSKRKPGEGYNLS